MKHVQEGITITIGHKKKAEMEYYIQTLSTAKVLTEVLYQLQLYKQKLSTAIMQTKVVNYIFCIKKLLQP